MIQIIHSSSQKINTLIIHYLFLRSDKRTKAELWKPNTLNFTPNNELIIQYDCHLKFNKIFKRELK